MSENTAEYDRAIEILSERFDEKDIADPEKTAEDVVAWYNSSSPDDEDIERLFNLVIDGKFEAWDCPTCGDRVFNGQPDDWGDFQGAWQQDLISYPGNNRNSEKQCDSCRCHGIEMDASALIVDDWANIDDILDEISERRHRR